MNVILITSDQHRWDALGCNSDVLKTPALDKLAAEGIVYDRAYTCNPVCTPARASILTGQYPSRHGAYTIGTALPEHCLSIPGAMSEAGCFTAICGKAHFQPCTNEPLGDNDSFEAPPHIFNWDFFSEWSGPYYGFQSAKLAIAHSDERNAGSMHYGLWLKEQGIRLEDYFGNGEYTGYGTWDLPEEYHNSRWTADETIAAIDMARQSDVPFFIWSSFQDPHNPCVVPEPWASMYDPGDMPDYRLHEGEFEGKPPFYRHAYEQDGRWGDPDLDCEKPWMCFRGMDFMDQRKTRELTAMYYGMVSLMDHHIGRILGHMTEAGLADDTLVIFTTDHGDYLGNHGLWWKGLPVYDDAQRIPFIVRHPGCGTPGARSDSLQSLVDIGPTALKQMGIPMPAGVQGMDQTEAWQDAHAAVRDWAMCEFRPTEGPFMQKTFWHGRWTLAVYHDRDFGELYDNQTDPEHHTNLWDSSEHAGVKADLLRRFISAEMEKDGVLVPRVAWA